MGVARETMGAKTEWECKDLTEDCPRLLSFCNRPRAFFGTFFFFLDSTFISYLLGPNWKHWCDNVGFFFNPSGMADVTKIYLGRRVGPLT